MISKIKLIEDVWSFYNGYGNNADVFSIEQTEAINKFLCGFQAIIENTKETTKECKQECLDCKYCICTHPYSSNCKHSELWTPKE